MIGFGKKGKKAQRGNPFQNCCKTDNNCLGARGETLAVQYLKKQHYRILARNFQTKQGEIDIIARHGNWIAFVEVKTRTCRDDTQSRFGTAATAVNAKKQQHIILAARQYLYMYPSHARPRLDVIEIYLSPCARAALLQCNERKARHFTDARVVWIQNAFGDDAHMEYSPVRSIENKLTHQSYKNRKLFSFFRK